MIDRLRSALFSLITLVNHRTTRREKIFLLIVGIIFVVSACGMIYASQSIILKKIPARGGTYTDAVVGIPRFVNPALAQSDADEIIMKLVYSGLTRETAPGVFTPDNASDFTVSDNGLVYTFTVRKNATFHDHKPVTAHDVVYTVEQLKKSTRLQNSGWQSVQVTSPDDQTVVFTLKQPYADFMRMTTVGILPAHIWEPLSNSEFNASDFNNTPVGSGPYQITGVDYNKSGIATIYHFKRFRKFSLGVPLLKNIDLHTLVNYDQLFELLTNNTLDGTMAHGSSEIISRVRELDGYDISTIPSSKVFGLFINPHATLIADTDVRAYIQGVINRNAIIHELTANTAYPLHRALPDGNKTEPAVNMQILTAHLTKKGWVKNKDTGIYEIKQNGRVIPLTITITTLDNPDLKKVTEMIKGQLVSAGISIEISIFQPEDLEREVLAQRNYQMLLFGYTASHPVDLYAFWHSSQRNYPGLNITEYQQTVVDRILTELISERDPEKIQKLLTEFHSHLAHDLPAVFIYNPADIVLSKLPVHMNIGDHVFDAPADRFNTIYEWYRQTDVVWNIFTH